MRKIVLFIAMSLDGYIADMDGKVDWLAGQDSNVEGDDSYADFINSVDTVIMGWTTYHQIVTDLSPGEWVYDNLQSYVITHKGYPSENNITFVSESPCMLVNSLKQKNGKDIWICGGANLVQQLVNQDFIDRYHITIIPTLLGSGVRLFKNAEHEVKLRLLDARSYNGMIDLNYVRR